MNEILKGLRVVEGCAFMAAPTAGMTLAQLGAEVIRFDPIGGGLNCGRRPIADDGGSFYWAGLNKGKNSIAVDIRSPEGRTLLTRLITAPGEQGGIFSTNFPARGWLGYDSLREHRSDLILQIATLHLKDSHITQLDGRFEHVGYFLQQAFIVPALFNP